MEKILVAKKGYTLKVESWENDADNWGTHFKTVNTIEEAQKIKFICQKLFVSCNNGDGGIGNSMDSEASDTIESFIKNNPELNLTKSEIDNLAYELMGASGYYDYRVFASIEITYLEEDVFAEKIK